MNYQGHGEAPWISCRRGLQAAGQRCGAVAAGPCVGLCHADVTELSPGNGTHNGLGRYKGSILLCLLPHLAQTPRTSQRRASRSWRNYLVRAERGRPQLEQACADENSHQFLEVPEACSAA